MDKLKNMDEKKKVIEVTLGLRREIAKTFKTSEVTVQDALRFKTKSPLSNLIRAYAMQHGGKMYEVRIQKQELENPYEKIKII